MKGSPLSLDMRSALALDMVIVVSLVVGSVLTRAEFEPKEGGEYNFEWKNGYALKGRISRYRKNRALAYTFGSDDDIVSFELSRRGNGTLLTLQDGLTDTDSLASRAGHWAYYLMNLKSVLENGKDLRSELDWEGID
jgi:uncharacterized protein YndB with AHSA1/START domain